MFTSYKDIMNKSDKCKNRFLKYYICIKVLHERVEKNSHFSTLQLLLPLFGVSKIVNKNPNSLLTLHV